MSSGNTNQDHKETAPLTHQDGWNHGADKRVSGETGIGVATLKNRLADAHRVTLSHHAT
jgi:hypothetical protein